MENFIFLDGALGTMLQKSGLKIGQSCEDFCMKNPDILKNIHKMYLKAGANIITANTFGTNSLKYDGDLEKAISFAINTAKSAIDELQKDARVALDVGPLGQLLEPVGNLSFEKAYEVFKEVMVIGQNCGADIILIETMSDIYEAKCALLAAKENTSLPVFCSMTFDETKRTLTGSDVKTVVAVLEGLNADVIGLNCGQGPYQSFEIAKEFAKYASVPLLVMPNAGMPKYENGKTTYDINEEEFAKKMLEISNLGVKYLGGCCGTTPTHIEKLVKVHEGKKYTYSGKKNYSVIASASKAVVVDEKCIVIGERINPTGKKKFKEALKNNDIDYILNEAISQKELGADVLDVNVGIPEIDEESVMERAIKEIQSVVDLPLQIDSSNYKTIETALRIYNGKPIVNSVNGKKSSMEKIFPLVKKYGAMVIGLTLDEDGIPKKCEERFEIAKRIVETAISYGIDKKDIIIDALTLTASAQQEDVFETLKTVKKVRDELNVKTALGVSNVSFGLPNREKINSSFLTMALYSGLNFAIINPKSKEIMDSVYSYNVLSNIDKSAVEYIEKVSEIKKDEEKQIERDLIYLIKSGLKDESGLKTKEMLKCQILPMDIIEKNIIPALNEVGEAFEKGTMFLPQLIQSAQCAQSAFFEIQSAFANENNKSKGKIIIATVKGDVHDIGKNIVKLLLQNYGYDVIDLGKNVDENVILDVAKKEDVKLVGLSALMTTTVENMEKTVKLLNKELPLVQTMVGGAVLTHDYAKSINADYYAKDALKAVEIANEVFGK
ncbi:MAG: homocysteine methyltransferase [Ruminococcaceae bacterium]|nr:homocysteine methyltransferase [Oscillospiraceae bacterium]